MGIASNPFDKRENVSDVCTPPADRVEKLWLLFGLQWWTTGVESVVVHTTLACGCSTVWSGTQYDCVTIVLVMRGIAQGVPTKLLADELERGPCAGRDGTLLERRHRIQHLALDNRPDDPLSDQQNEAKAR